MDTILLANRSQRPALVAELESTGGEMVDRVLRHPFLAGCANGTVTLEQLREYLVQHGKYARYFTRYLCALISQLDEGEDVLKLAENLTEELGFGDDTELRIPHARIYADMLKDLDIDPAVHPTNPETQSLIDTMFMLCRQPRGTAGLGAMCLGAEGLVPAMYARIMEGFRHCGVDEKRLEFFAIHIECDDGHAGTMYEILARETEVSPSARITALNAGDIAVNARLRFFDALTGRVQ
jgi:pyrroloquinoline quinone (PQQ) biosynthesis protein C